MYSAPAVGSVASLSVYESTTGKRFAVSRAERFDAVVFLDLPGADEKQAIWDLYLGMFEIDRDQRLPKDDNFTGAEIRACCRLAALLDVPLNVQKRRLRVL